MGWGTWDVPAYAGTQRAALAAAWGMRCAECLLSYSQAAICNQLAWLGGVVTREETTLMSSHAANIALVLLVCSRAALGTEVDQPANMRWSTAMP